MITLASDFGDPYPAAMKGVILGRCDARLVDVSHTLPRHDVRTAAFWLRTVLPWFPPAVHLVVVDPGVGTDRDGVVVAAADHYLVGPDNGVLLPPARRLAADGDDLAAFLIDESHFSPPVATFHGRDVFAPTAADVHEHGIDAPGDLEYLEPIEIADLVDLRLPRADVGREAAEGEVLAVDSFGNVITNVPGSGLLEADPGTVTVGGGRTTETVPFRASYGAVPVGEKLVTVASHGYVELAVNRGRGDEAYDLEPGSAVRLSW